MFDFASEQDFSRGNHRELALGSGFYTISIT